jgi:hypothetical protein
VQFSILVLLFQHYRSCDHKWMSQIKFIQPFLISFLFSIFSNFFFLVFWLFGCTVWGWTLYYFLMFIGSISLFCWHFHFIHILQSHRNLLF